MAWILSMKFLFAPFLSIFKHLQLLRGAVAADVSQRYAGSIIGLFWCILYPVILFCIYSTLYLFIFRVRPVEMTSTQYVVYIMSGLVPFLGFSEALLAGTTSISSKKSLLLNTVYPSEFIPLQTVIANHVSIFVGVFLLFIANYFLIHHVTWAFLMIPFLIIIQIMFTAGIVWVLSILNLLIKDIQQSLAFVTMLLMIVSPIAYTPSMVPHALKIIIWANPFSYYVWSFQDLFVKGVITDNLAIAACISLFSFSLGFLFYNKTKRVFYEYV
jgi:homopolymeric O-antigen transport system permease protein